MEQIRIPFRHGLGLLKRRAPSDGIARTEAARVRTRRLFSKKPVLPEKLYTFSATGTELLNR